MMEDLACIAMPDRECGKALILTNEKQDATLLGGNTALEIDMMETKSDGGSEGEVEEEGQQNSGKDPYLFEESKTRARETKESAGADPMLSLETLEGSQSSFAYVESLRAISANAEEPAFNLHHSTAVAMQGDRSSAGKAAHVVELRSSRATKAAEALDEADQTGHFKQADLDESKGHDSIQGLNTRIDAPREVEGNIHFTHINTKSLGQEARVSSLSDVDAVLEDLDRWAAVDRRLLDELGIAEASLEQDRLRSDESETMIRLRSQCDEWRLRMLEAEGRAAVASEKLARLESAQTSVAEVSALFASHERRMEAVVLSSVAAALESVGDGLRQAKSPGDSSKSPGKNNAAVRLSSASKDKSSSPSREDDSQSAAARKEASLLDKIRSLEKELAATGKERDEAVQREFAVSEKLKAAEVVGNNARAQYEEAVHDLREDMKARLMERQSAEAQRISGLEQEVEKLTTSLEAKDHALLDLQDELARVKQESAAKTQILEDDVARLTRENGNLESTVHDSQLELARIKHDLATRRSDEDDLLARLAAFQASQIAAASPPSSPRGARSSSTVAASLSSWWQNA